MKPFYERPCAARGLTSYRYRCRYGWIMIGAKDDMEALKEAGRSTEDRPLTFENLQIWDGTKYRNVTEAL